MNNITRDAIDCKTAKSEADWERRTRAAVYSMVEAELGGGRVICDRCHATLDTFSDACSADLLNQCQGFLAIDKAKADARRKAMAR